MQKLPTSPEPKNVISEKYGKSLTTRDERYMANLIGSVSPRFYKFMSIASGAILSGFASNTVNSETLISPSNATSAFAGGLAGYALHKYLTRPSFAKTFSLMSANIQNELNDFEYPADNHLKLYSRKGTKQAFLFANSEIKLSMIETARKYASIIPSFHRRLDKPYIQESEKDTSRIMFVFQLLSDLDNDSSPFARRLKEENTFNRDVIKNLLSDSHKFANLVTEQTNSPNAFAKEMIKALGTDAEFVIKEFREYNKGKKEVFFLQVDAYHDALKNIQTENVYKEFSMRFLDMMARGSTGELDRDPKALERVRNRFSEFTTSRFSSPEHNQNQLIKLSQYSNDIIRNLDKLAETGNIRSLSESFKSRIGLRGDLSGYLDPDNKDKKKQAADLLAAHFLTGNNEQTYELNRTFERMFVDSFLKKIQSNIKAFTSKDLDPKELDKLNNQQLAAKLDNYKLSDLEYLNPENATEAIMMRIKARLYYQLNKESCDAQFHTAAHPDNNSFEP
ncbi:hypothetical protein L1267_19075 [Pseudoalteromonas sp. OFAV1]|uniref:hypothetical protein n=1 Tax=Pseudoalteromonas sp. OFAV1 TaxID=2908892 RepID=UPI001F2E1523|nr:hypothetical protein [Pseudoalteromonas sp. OFAV1]MCF2902477.1 hypothetical protein [Pseudoalteromonas sp. OFAV1]